MAGNTGEILGERFVARDGVVVIDDTKPILFRIRKFEDHRARSARGVQVMVQRQGQKTSKNVYVSGDRPATDWTIG